MTKASVRKRQAQQALRAVERRLFGQVTVGLIAANDPGQGDAAAARALALAQNASLWAELRADLIDPATGLPTAIRAQLVNLARWVEQETEEARTGGPLDALIRVNEAMIDGLG